MKLPVCASQKSRPQENQTSVGGRGTLHGARAVFGSFQNFILKGNAFGIVLLEPRFRGILIGEHLDVFRVTDLLAGGRRLGR